MSHDVTRFLQLQQQALRYSTPRQQIPALRPNDAMPQKHVADNASWFPLHADGASFLSLGDEVAFFVTGGAIIALDSILLLRVPVSSFLRPMAEVHATTWTIAPPLVCREYEPVLGDEVACFVTGGAIIALHSILLLLVPGFTFLCPMAEVDATTWTMARPLVCLISLHGGWAWARYLVFCCG